MSLRKLSVRHSAVPQKSSVHARLPAELRTTKKKFQKRIRKHKKEPEHISRCECCPKVSFFLSHIFWVIFPKRPKLKTVSKQGPLCEEPRWLPRLRAWIGKRTTKSVASNASSIINTAMKFGSEGQKKFRRYPTRKEENLWDHFVCTSEFIPVSVPLLLSGRYPSQVQLRPEAPIADLQDVVCVVLFRCFSCDYSFSPRVLRGKNHVRHNVQDRLSAKKFWFYCCAEHCIYVRIYALDNFFAMQLLFLQPKL